MNILKLVAATALSAILITPSASLANHKKGKESTPTERKASKKTKATKSSKGKVKTGGKVSKKNKQKIEEANFGNPDETFVLPAGETFVFE